MVAEVPEAAALRGRVEIDVDGLLGSVSGRFLLRRVRDDMMAALMEANMEWLKVATWWGEDAGV